LGPIVFHRFKTPKSIHWENKDTNKQTRSPWKDLNCPFVSMVMNWMLEQWVLAHLNRALQRIRCQDRLQTWIFSSSIEQCENPLSIRHNYLLKLALNLYNFNEESHWFYCEKHFKQKSFSMIHAWCGHQSQVIYLTGLPLRYLSKSQLERYITKKVFILQMLTRIFIYKRVHT